MDPTFSPIRAERPCARRRGESTGRVACPCVCHGITHRGPWSFPTAIKQRIQSSHVPTRHGHLVIATNLNSLFDLLRCSTPQTRAEGCLQLTAVSGYRMFLGLFG